MATKKAPAKDAVAKKTAPKVPATVPAKKAVASRKKKTVEGGMIVSSQEAKVTLTSFTMKALIPTMAYGNISTEITVQAHSIEEAHAFCMPYVQDMYKSYADVPLNGRTPNIFPQKASVTETEKIVTPPTPAPVPMPSQPPMPAAQVPAQEESKGIAKPASNVVSFEKDGAIKQPTTEEVRDNTISKSASFQKAENAIANSFTIETLDGVQKKITDSPNMGENEKNFLYEKLLKKRAELNAK